MSYERYERERERAECPTDDEMIAGLDAFGHLNWTVGDDEWIACFDFEVHEHPERGTLVAYHVVVDGPGFIDTVEAHVVEPARAPWGLPSYWADIARENGVLLDDEELKNVAERWRKDLRHALGMPVEEVSP